MATGQINKDGKYGIILLLHYGRVKEYWQFTLEGKAYRHRGDGPAIRFYTQLPGAEASRYYFLYSFGYMNPESGKYASRSALSFDEHNEVCSVVFP